MLQTPVVRGEHVVCDGEVVRIADMIPASELATMNTVHPLAIPRESARFLQPSMYLLVQYYELVPKEESTIPAPVWEKLGALSEVSLTLRFKWVPAELPQSLVVVVPHERVLDPDEYKLQCLQGCPWVYVVAVQQVPISARPHPQVPPSMTTTTTSPPC